MKGIKLFSISLAIIFLSANAYSQPNYSAGSIVAKINEQIASTQRGYFTSTYKFKSAPKEDTSSAQGVVYVFALNESPDTFKQFIVVRNSRVWKAYDGLNFYELNHEKKTVKVTDVTLNGGIKNLLKGQVDMLAFRPYLYQNRDAIKLPASENAIFTAINGEKITITTVDSFKNELKIAAIDPDMGSRVFQYEIESKSMKLIKRTEWVYFMKTPQFTENIVSPLYPLPESQRFETVFNRDSLSFQGYKFVDKSNANPSNDTKGYTFNIGDTIPDFQLESTLGDSIFHLPTVNAELIVFDFWYRSCYPCLKAMPVIEKLHQQYKGRDVLFWGIDGHDSDKQKLANFLQERNVSYPTLLDKGRSIEHALGIKTFPIALIVNGRTKKILSVHRGYSENLEADISNAIEQLLNK